MPVEYQSGRPAAILSDIESGTDAATIGVNPAIAANAALIQAAATPGAAGDNTIAVALGQIADQPMSALNGQTLNEHYATSIATLGQSLATVTNLVSDQGVVNKMLLQQRDSVSGVSVDEEMSDMVRYQKAFEASARLISTVDQMLDTVVNLKR